MKGGVPASVDAIVIGAGAIGLSTAKHLAEAGHTVHVVEQEHAPGLHQSGRNSAVIHPGHNLLPNSAKARYCVAGSRRLRAYCDERGIACEELGILVAAQDEEQARTLHELERRARANGVRAEMLDPDGIRRVEPHARGVAALHAPEGASFDPHGYAAALADDVRSAGGTVDLGTHAHRVQEDAGAVHVRTDRGTFHARVAVNCAGLQADRVAGAVAHDVRVVPFRGAYAELVPARRDLVRGHVYPAPDLRFPFLGVHLSRRVDGRVIIGPGATVALGREAYDLPGIRGRDLAATLAWPGFARMVADRTFLRLARREVAQALSLRAVAKAAGMLVPGIRKKDITRAFAGNRAQMVDRKGNLVDDILMRTTERAVHVLNAVSPGLTCSLPFGEDVARQAAQRI